jgi:hypothetical protein
MPPKTKKEQEQIIITFGEKRPSGEESIRIYFTISFPAAPDREYGFQTPQALKAMRQTWKENKTTEFGDRMIKKKLSVLQNIYLNMHCIYSSLFQQTQRSRIQLELDKAAPHIRIVPVSGFGMFEGRAHVRNVVSCNAQMPLKAVARLDTIAPGFKDLDMKNPGIII